MKTRTWSAAITAFVAAALSTLSASASTNTWVGNTDANWSTAANWSFSSGSGPVTSGDSLTFGAAGSAGTSLNNDLSGLTINKLTFSGGASSFTFSGNGFTNGTGGIDASALSSGTQTINNLVTLGTGVQRWNVGAGGTLAFGNIGVLGGDATDTYSAAGAIAILSKTGTLKTTVANGWGWRAGGPGLLGPGMVIDNGDNTYDWAASTGSSPYTIAAATYVAAGASDKNNVKIMANTTLTLNASWASLLVSNATFTINGANLYFDTGIILENGGTLNGAAPLKANSDGLYIYTPDTGTIASSIQNNGANAKILYKAGPGVLSLSGNSSYTGGTILYSGTLSAGAASAFGNGTLTINGGNLDCSSANLALNNNIAQNWNTDFTFVGSQNLNMGSGTVTISASRQVTVSSNALAVGTIVDGGMGYGLTKAGNGALKLAGGYSYSGPTIVCAGTLKLDAAQTSSANALTVSNAALSLSVNNGSSSINAANIAFRGNTALNVDYGTATTPGVAAIYANGYTVSNTGTNIINITGPNLTVGQYPIIYTGGSVPTNNFVLGSVSVGLVAVLTNSGSSLDLLVTSTGQTLTWYGADSLGNPLTTWDVNTSSNWNNGTAKYLQYAGNSYGDYVTFDDSLYTASGADITLNGTVVPASLYFNNWSTPYAITGSGSISGSTTLVKNGIATTYLGTSNSYTGGTIINLGTLSVASDSALGVTNGTVTLNNGSTLQFSNTTASVRGITMTANSVLDIAAGANAQLAGVISGAAGLTKVGNGTLSLGGSNTFSGAAVVSAGELSIVGGSSGNASQHTVGNVSGTAATMTIAGGNFQATRGGNVWDSSLQLATANSAVGRLQVSSGSLAVTKQLAVGANAQGYGIYSQTGGDVIVGGFLAMGLGSDQSIFNQSGGTFTLTGAPATCGAGGTGLGVINLSGTAAFNVNASGDNGLWVGESGTGLLNIFSGAALSFAAGNNGLQLARNGGSIGIVNLLGGTVTTKAVYQGGGTGTLNFNGGALKAAAANGSFLAGLNAAYVYSGGATIDDGGFAITVAQPLLAPTGDGVVSISVDNGGSGYVDTPIVTISGGGGSGATAVATVAGGVVTGFTVTCPGVDYTSAPTVTIVGGGGSGAAGTASLVANTSGGLTKIGNGTLTLNDVNSYLGSTKVNAGTLAGTGTIAGALTNNATLAPGTGGSGSLTINGDIRLSATSTNIFSVNGTTPANTSVIAGGNVTYGGVLKISTNGTFTLGQQFQLFSGVGATNASSFANVLGSPGTGLAFSFTNGVLSVVAGGPAGPATITNIVSGNSLNLTWPAGQGWRLQAQTNSLSVGLTTNGWVNVSAADGSYSATMSPTDPSVFYRLVYP